MGINRTTFEGLNEVISSFYDASLGKVSWEEPLQHAAVVMNSSSAVFSVRDPVTRKAHFSFGNFGADSKFVQSFSETYAILSPFLISTALSSEGKAVNPINLIGRDDYERGRFHKEWSAPQGYHDYLGSVLMRQRHATYTIAFGRKRQLPLFDSADTEKLEFLTPHITRALQISEKLNTFERERAELLSTLDLLPTAIFLIDRKYRIRQINTSALRLIDSDQGVSNKNGTLHFSDPLIQSEFQSKRNVETGHAVSLDLKLKNGMQINLLAHKIRNENQPDRIDEERILVVIDQPTIRTAPLAENLTAKFGFTIAELRVLLSIADGNSSSKVASDLGVSKTTVKTHLSHMFQKTNTHSQRELLKAVSAIGQSELMTSLINLQIQNR